MNHPSEGAPADGRDVLVADLPGSPAVIHLPHASTDVPDDVRPTLLLGDDALQSELVAMTDHRTDELAELVAADVPRIRFPVSRLVVDPERFRDDADEPMAGRGMGAVYTRTSTGGRLRDPVAPEARERLLAAFYDPHHQRLRIAVAAALGVHGHCVIIDLHSFPSRPLPYEDARSVPRPGICIGTDAFHTPPWLAAALVASFEADGLSVALNTPFAGALVPQPWWNRDPRVMSVMIEMNRGLYLDEASGARGPRFPEIRASVGRAIAAALAAAQGAAAMVQSSKGESHVLPSV